MKKLLILKGLPASGKSTYSKSLLLSEPNKWKRINRDDLRKMLDDSAYTKQNESFIRIVQDELIYKALNNNFNVVLDNTSLISETLKKLHILAEDVGDVLVIEKGFNTPIEECHRRNSLREGIAKVPSDVIDNMAKHAGITRGVVLADSEVYYPARNAFKTVEQNAELPRAIVCDLDGTLAIIGDRSPYDASRCDEVDLPNWPVIQSVKQMYNAGIKIIFMSGRDSKYREPTEKFIQKYISSWPSTDINHNVLHDGKIPYELYMRSEGDQRKDSVIKKELFEAHVANKYNIFVVYDDRNSVVDLWRSLGLTCFQVGPGNF